ncbi:PIN domain-containing protein [Embleya sp. NBC_00896]|uniref:PIN domain-containing protein n=1 Tax=Embleya sp. NBC_00896 TaxID=2975961 RepID=UPI00386E546A|nr:PIN domain-containing protein [Embleya sp. NBC_00896]
MTQDLYLADTSALVRFFRRQTSEAWHEPFAAGRVGLCEPIRLEFLRGVGPQAAYEALDTLTNDMLPYFHVPESVWTEAAALQHRLWEKSQHECASVVDLVAAITAARHNLVLLHADRDFEVIAKLTGQPVKRIDAR